MPPIRAVLFDLDRTLVDLEGAIRIGIEAHLLDLGLPFSPEEYARWKEYEEEFVTRFVIGELTLKEQRRARVRAMTRAAELADDDADAWFEGFHTRMHAAQRTFEDTGPALEALAVHDHLKIGIVTNMETGYQLAKLANVGLHADRFDCVLGLDLLPAPKPEPAAFLAGCAAVGTDPAETLFVGDEPYIDAVGARDAGLRSVWLDRTGRAAQIDPAELAGIDVVSSLAELADLGDYTDLTGPKLISER
ncbi:MAG TPA: HAD family hydrolase [Actinocrinis sp.]|nr:HAD family hydrolase [Actinocrinis sp.]